VRLQLACLTISLSFGLIGCDSDPGDDDDGVMTCQVTPGAWSATGFEANAAEVTALRAQLDKLTGAETMRGAEQGMVTVDDVADLTAIYEGTPSLAGITSDSLDGIINDAFAEFVAVLQAGQVDLVDDQGAWTPGASGGIFGMRAAGINAGGIELRQIVDKGLYGSFYVHAVRLTEGQITEATIDALAAAWGVPADLGTMMLADSANYAFQMGLHAETAKALTDAKAYAADDKCTMQRDAAIESFFRLWEQALFARTIFYANAAATELAAPTGDDSIADALHELAEGLGLALALYGAPNPTRGPLAGSARVATDAQIQAMMTALGVRIDDLNASTTGQFVPNPTGLQTGVTEVEADVMEIFGLSQAEIQSYRMPTEG